VTSCTAAGAVAGVAYTASVRAHNVTGYSSVASGSGSGVPAAPTVSPPTVAADGTVSVSWSKNGANAASVDGFDVVVVPSRGGSGNLTCGSTSGNPLLIRDGTVTSCTAPGAVAGA